MNKITGTLAAITESLRGFYDMRLRPYRWLILVFILLLVLGLFLSLRDSLRFAALERRERERQSEREQLQKQADEWEGRAKAAEARAKALESDLSALRSEQSTLTRAVATSRHSRHKLEKHHEKSLQDIEKITDADLLHRLNCERRAALGFPCSNE